MILDKIRAQIPQHITLWLCTQLQMKAAVEVADVYLCIENITFCNSCPYYLPVCKLVLNHQVLEVRSYRFV